MTPSRLRWAVTLFAATALPLGPGLAGSSAIAATGTVSISTYTHVMTVTADVTAPIDVTIVVTHDPILGDFYRVHDAMNDLTASSPCEGDRSDLHTVQCPKGVVESYQVNGSTENDRVDVSGIDLSGGMFAKAGDDVLKGGSGKDAFDPGLGKDKVIGGAEEDQVSYLGRLAGVRISLDGQANDGTPGEGDNVMPDVENVFGSQFDDKLVGSSANNTLVGSDGDDVLDGAGGDDVLLGGDDIDTVSYASHAVPVDVTLDDAGSDGAAGEADQIQEIENVTGGAGNDELTGSAGANVLRGGAGGDSLNAARPRARAEMTSRTSSSAARDRTPSSITIAIATCAPPSMARRMMAAGSAARATTSTSASRTSPAPRDRTGSSDPVVTMSWMVWAGLMSSSEPPELTCCSAATATTSLTIGRVPRRFGSALTAWVAMARPVKMTTSRRTWRW